MKKHIIFLIFVAFLGSSCGSKHADTLNLNDEYALPFVMPEVELTSFGSKTFDITEYGAKSGGEFKNTEAINSAIIACNVAGGGRVVVPQGLWLTGPIELKSNVDLHLQRGALVVFSRDFDDYGLVDTYFEGWRCMRKQSPLSGRDLENVAITGEGIFDGSGDAWRPTKKSRMASNEWQRLIAGGGVLNDQKDIWFPTESSLLGHQTTVQGWLSQNADKEDYKPIEDYLRPNMLSLINCRRVLLSGNTYHNSPCWTLHPFGCKHVVIENVKVLNPWYAQNGDALDLESCRVGIVRNCTFDTGDDGICIKSGKDKQGRERAMPTAEFVFDNVTVYRSHGGFVIGSEMSGGVSNLFLTNCSFVECDLGFRFKSNRNRGGVVENIWVDGVRMSNIIGDAVFFGMYYNGLSAFPALEEKKLEQIDVDTIDYEVGDGTPCFRNFHFKNIYGVGIKGGAFNMTGLKEMPLGLMTFENVYLQTKYGIAAVDAGNVEFKNVVVDNSQNDKPVIVRSDGCAVSNIVFK